MLQYLVCKIFKGKLGAIQEIQIQGHADPQQSRNFSSNLELAAHRAIEVFKHFQKLGIDPTRHIMSATSFGEYKPVQRQYSDMAYNNNRLKRDNNTQKKRKKNRRIEVVLIYRRTY
ncbi:MAG: OmpA family protein [Candidatus Parabeggiatoa sp.]|nr:OmpA family protein [Candidatus Parabeggiatoa sp.]